MYVLLYVVFIKSFRLRKTVVLPCDLYFKTYGIVTLFPLVTKFFGKTTTLPQNELKRDVVRFTTHVQTC